MLVVFSFATPVNAMGIFYTNATYPVLATGASAEKLKVYKKGESFSQNYLFLIEKGDAGIRRAALNGGITKIHFIDVHEKNIFIFYKEVTTIVYGE